METGSFGISETLTTVDGSGGHASESQFVASVSHELRGPLHAILGLSELLLQANIRESDKRMVAALNREATSLQVLIDDILDYARATSGKLELVETTFSPALVVADLIETTRPSASSKGISISLEVEPSTPQSTIGDAVRYGQVVRNLLSNAVRYTKQGQIRAVLRQDSTGHVVCEVQDSGVGIAPEKLDTLFQPFEQADANGGVGAGLGLAICERLATLMGGQIGVTSVESEGSTFSFSVALETSERRAAAKQTPLATTNARTGAILVVEDNEVNQMLARSQLELLGFQADIAPDGETALGMIDDQHLAVLMDWNLPGIDGLQTTRLIRDQRPPSRRVPIIAMTANALSGDRDRCIAAGMDDFLAKPVGIDALREMLETWLPDTVAGDTAAAKTEAVHPEILERLADELGDRQIVRDLVDAFLGELPSQLEALEANVEGADNSRAQSSAHTLKSTASLLGATNLADLCQRLSQLPIVDSETISLTKKIKAEADRVTNVFVGYLGERS